MLVATLLAVSLVLVVVVGAALSQQAVLWLGAGLLVIGAVLVVAGLHWPTADRHWDAMDELFDDRMTPIHVAILGGLVAAGGAVVALVGAIPW